MAHGLANESDDIERKGRPQVLGTVKTAVYYHKEWNCEDVEVMNLVLSEFER